MASLPTSDAAGSPEQPDGGGAAPAGGVIIRSDIHFENEPGCPGQPAETEPGCRPQPAEAEPGFRAQAAETEPGVRAQLRWVAALPASRAVIEPLAPARYKVQFTASAELRDKLERLLALMRSSIPDGDLAVVIEAAVTEKLERLEARRFGRTSSPRKSAATSDTTPRTRHVPAAVRRAVDERDQGQCRYVDAEGHRCTARVSVQLHHRVPWAVGGDHSLTNISTLCAAHNRFLAEIDFGREAVGRHRRSAGAARGSQTKLGWADPRWRGRPG
jgi:hypothetical protein